MFLQFSFQYHIVFFNAFLSWVLNLRAFLCNISCLSLSISFFMSMSTYAILWSPMPIPNRSNPLRTVEKIGIYTVDKLDCKESLRRACLKILLSMVVSLFCMMSLYMILVNVAMIVLMVVVEVIAAKVSCGYD